MVKAMLAVPVYVAEGAGTEMVARPEASVTTRALAEPVAVVPVARPTTP